MGQIIVFPVPPTPFPDLAAELNTARWVLFIPIRWWGESYRDGEDPGPRLCMGLKTTGAPVAAFSIDSLMRVIIRAVRRPIKMHCPRGPRLSLDEKHPLCAAELAQAGESALAVKVLRTTLLAAQSDEFAIDPPQGLSELFARTRLFLSRSRSRIEDEATGDSREAWSPPCSARSQRDAQPDGNR